MVVSYIILVALIGVAAFVRAKSLARRIDRGER